MLRIAFVEWPEGLLVDDAQWNGLSESVNAACPDILVTNEMPVGAWIAEGAEFSESEARRSICAHEKALEALSSLDATAVISSRPVWNGKRLAM